MNDPICAVCGETRVGELLMYSSGECLCGRCNEIAAHAFIKMHADEKLKELEKAEQDRLAAKRLQGFRDKSKVAEAAIKFALGTHESLREQCSMCGKAVHPSLITRVQGEYGGLPDRLCPDCLKKYKLKKAEEATQIHIADLSIENNRLRTKVKDLEKAHSDFSDRCFWFFCILLGIGVAAGIIFSDIFK
ncbi:hypothetical protein BT566P1_00036 [Bacteroides phage BT566P1]|nr:hypothetical protein BT566P1_00036 [Bacteroides phage BT566P1]WAX09432.1 hypothetical protein BT566P2_00003 [Bacteroides phage BT566P2]